MFKKIIVIELLITLVTTLSVSLVGTQLLGLMNVIVSFNLFEFVMTCLLFWAFIDFAWYIYAGKEFVKLLHGNDDDRLFAKSKLFKLKKDLRLAWAAFVVATIIGAFNPAVFIFALMVLIIIICAYSFIHLVNYYYFA